MTALSLRIPLRLLRGSYLRLGLTVVALACGVALVCAIDVASTAVLGAFSEVIDAMAGRAALQVRAADGALFPEDATETVAKVPGVRQAVPVVSATAFTDDDSGELLTVHGIDIGLDSTMRLYESRDDRGLEVEDPLLFLSQPDSVAMTRTFLERHGLAVGDGIMLDTPTGRKHFIIRGSLEPHGIARVLGGNLVVMDIFAAEKAFTRPGFINRVDIGVEPGMDITGVADAIVSALPAGFHVEPPAERKADVNKGIQVFALILRGVALLGLGAAMLIAYNRVGAVFEANVWQLGVLQAVGVSARRVWWELLKESLILGIAGTMLGIPLGIALARLALPVLSSAMALAYNLTPADAAFALSPQSILLATATGIGAAILAAAAPAWRATRLGIVATIRGRGTEQPIAVTRGMWVVRALVATGIFGGIVAQTLTHSPGWGLLATGLMAIAAVLAARPLLALTGGMMSRATRRLAGPIARFAADSVLQNPRRSTLTAAMLGVGLATVLWLSMLGSSFERSVSETMTSVFRADLVVSSVHVASGFFEAPLEDAIVTELKAIPEVLAVAGERLIELPYRGGPIIVNAFDPEYFLDAGFGRWPLYGRHVPDVWQTVARGDGVIASSNLMLNLGLGVDDRVVLETPSGPLSVPISGVTLDFASGRGTLEISKTLYERLWHDAQVTRVFVRARPGADLGALRATIARAVGRRYRVKVISGHELVEYFATQVRRAFASVYVLAGMILLVVLVGMADTLAGAVSDRSRQLGVLRAVGVEPFHLRRLVLCEAVTLGTLGVVLALGAGLAMGALWVHATFPYLFGWVLSAHVPWLPAMAVACLTILVCVMAGLMPARRAARVDPVIALRED